MIQAGKAPDSMAAFLSRRPMDCGGTILFSIKSFCA